jgi:hypothetical protein
LVLNAITYHSRKLWGISWIMAIAWGISWTMIAVEIIKVEMSATMPDFVTVPLFCGACLE